MRASQSASSSPCQMPAPEWRMLLAALWPPCTPFFPLVMPGETPLPALSSVLPSACIQPLPGHRNGFSPLSPRSESPPLPTRDDSSLIKHSLCFILHQGDCHCLALWSVQQGTGQYMTVQCDPWLVPLPLSSKQAENSIDDCSQHQGQRPAHRQCKDNM